MTIQLTANTVPFNAGNGRKIGTFTVPTATSPVYFRIQDNPFNYFLVTLDGSLLTNWNVWAMPGDYRITVHAGNNTVAETAAFTITVTG